MTHQPYQLPFLTMSDIRWDHRIVRVSRPEGYGCGYCSKPVDAYIRATGKITQDYDSVTRGTAIVNLPCGCAAVGLTWWRAAPDVLARLILVAEAEKVGL